MAALLGSGVGLRARWITRLFLCAFGLAVGVDGVWLAGQDEPTRTLHAYTDSVQIPVLVLSPQREVLPPIAPAMFSVVIDGGPKFRASHVRLEGDDPISLSILLDVSGDEAALMSKLSGVIAGLAPLSLGPMDHVSIYALDCAMVRSMYDEPADRARLQVGVNEALQSWIDRVRRDHRSSCKQKVHLWDALGVVIKQMSQFRGRRVILAMTGGIDRGSSNNWNRVRLFAQESGVAIFGLRAAIDSRLVQPGFLSLNAEDVFNSLCELTGGLVIAASQKTMSKDMERFVETVRGRYIVEFPRPLHGTAGPHDLLVSIDKSDAFIRPAGASVPIIDPALLADPTTVPSNPSQTPELGKRRVLTTPH